MTFMYLTNDCYFPLLQCLATSQWQTMVSISCLQERVGVRVLYWMRHQR